jgi:hypothetical protein
MNDEEGKVEKRKEEETRMWIRMKKEEVESQTNWNWKKEVKLGERI